LLNILKKGVVLINFKLDEVVVMVRTTNIYEEGFKAIYLKNNQ